MKILLALLSLCLLAFTTSSFSSDKTSYTIELVNNGCSTLYPVEWWGGGYIEGIQVYTKQNPQLCARCDTPFSTIHQSVEMNSGNAGTQSWTFSLNSSCKKIHVFACGPDKYGYDSASAFTIDATGLSSASKATFTPDYNTVTLVSGNQGITSCQMQFVN